MQSAGASAFRDPGLFTLMAMSADAEKLAQAQGAIESELELLKQELVSDSEINRALKKLKAHTLYARDGSFSLASQLNEAIASGDWTLYTRFLERAEKVTAEKIQEVSVRYFGKRERTVGLYYPS